MEQTSEKCYCQCNCGNEIKRKIYHKYYGKPKFIVGHNSRLETHEAMLKRTHKRTKYKHSSETKKKIGLSNKGKIITADIKRKIAETLKKAYSSGKLINSQKNKFIKDEVNGRRQNYYRRFAFIYYGRSCLRCDSSAVLVHHKDENWRNNNIENLEPLCKSCHSKEHKIGENFNGKLQRRTA